MNNLCLLKAVSLSRLTTDISSRPALRERLIEENRLGVLWKGTKERFQLSVNETYPHYIIPQVSRINKKGKVKAKRPVNRKSKINLETVDDRFRSFSKINLESRFHTTVQESSVINGDSTSMILRPLSMEVNLRVSSLLNSTTSSDEIIFQFKQQELQFTDTLRISSLRRLRPGVWLDDAIINSFFKLLSMSDAIQNENNRRNHFLNTFFFSKLLGEGSYNYNNVRRWSRHSPGRNIFDLSEIYIPVHLSDGKRQRGHWALLVISMQDRLIQYFDSLHIDGTYFRTNALKYLKDEWQTKFNTEFDELLWIVTDVSDCPVQRNGDDCGVFTCMFAYFISQGQPLLFNQDHIPLYGRQRLAISLLEGRISLT